MSDTKNLKSKLERLRAEHITEINRIDKLIEAMQEAERYVAGDATTQSISNGNEPVKSKSDAVRVREALEHMNGTFTSTKLWEKANSDGGPPIDKRKSFAPYFTRLKKANLVVEVKPHSGNTPGIYKRP